MSKYQDRNSLWHDKPCINGEPRSNNRNIYSAYSKYLAPNTINKDEMEREYYKCLRSLWPLKIDRLPNKTEPPLSKDEIIGLVSLGLTDPKHVIESHYNFCNQDIEFERKLSLKSTYKAIKALIRINKESKNLEGSAKRNYMWENKIVDAYPLGFKLAPWDIFYIKKMAGKRPNILEAVLFYLNAYTTIKKGNKSVRMMLWLQLKDLKHPLLKYIPLNKFVTDYFGKGHDFTINVNNGDVL